LPPLTPVLRSSPQPIQWSPGMYICTKIHIYIYIYIYKYIYVSYTFICIYLKTVFAELQSKINFLARNMYMIIHTFMYIDTYIHIFIYIFTGITPTWVL
jgi:hypothetical protein